MAPLSEFATVTFIMIIIMFAGDAVPRDLRPSDHGLLFQNSPPAPPNSSTEMRSFFNSSPSSTSSDVSLPRSTDSLPPPLPLPHGGGGGGRWGGVLTVASLVCGITGVILLVASALLYVFTVKKPRKGNTTLNDSFRHIIDHNDNDSANKMHFVPVVNNL